MLFDYIAQEAPRRIKTYSMQSVCMLASAFASQRRSDEALFEKIGNYSCNNATNLYPRAVATILFAFSEVEIRHGVLFFNAPQHVAKNVKAYTTDELAMVARAYGTFTMVHLPLFDTITQALPDRPLVPPGVDDQQLLPTAAAGADGVDAEMDADLHPSGLPGKAARAAAAVPTFDIREEVEPPSPEQQYPRAMSLVWLLEAYARLTIFEAPILELLCDSLCRRHEEVTAPLAVQALKAAAALSFSHPGLVQLGLSVVAKDGENMTFEELETITRALEELGVDTGEGGLDAATLPLLERPSRDGAESPGRPAASSPS